jgi:chromosomal replication initiator protein
MLIRTIQRATCAAMGITMQEMLSDNRERRVAHPRQTAMYLAHYHGRGNLSAIGRCFGRDHSTVIHAIRRVRSNVDRLVEAGRVREMLW